MFEDMGVMKKNELEARNEVKWETYTKKIQIEARVMGAGKNSRLPLGLIPRVLAD